MEDAVCSEEIRGTLRELTRPEQIWVDRYAYLHAAFEDQAEIIGRQRQQGLTL